MLTEQYGSYGGKLEGRIEEEVEGTKGNGLIWLILHAWLDLFGCLIETRNMVNVVVIWAGVICFSKICVYLNRFLKVFQCQVRVLEIMGCGEC